LCILVWLAHFTSMPVLFIIQPLQLVTWYYGFPPPSCNRVCLFVFVCFCFFCFVFLVCFFLLPGCMIVFFPSNVEIPPLKVVMWDFPPPGYTMASQMTSLCSSFSLGPRLARRRTFTSAPTLFESSRCVTRTP